VKFDYVTKISLKLGFFICSLILGINYFRFGFRFIFSLILGLKYFCFGFRFIFSLFLVS
jgi:hypothetical protein